MQSLRIDFDETTRSIGTIDDATAESWEAVCDRFDNDVRRIMAVSDEGDYTAVYACYDENNDPVYYLVEESEALSKLRRRRLLSKLGRG